MRIDCTCHDPTVFGHITCSRAETQPNNTVPRPPDTSHFTSINASTITAASINCSRMIYEEAQTMRRLGETSREAAQQIDALTTMIRYIDRRYNEGDPPPHG